MLKNTRHEMFSQALAAGRNASEAYVDAGFKANSGNAATLKAKQYISKRVAEILTAREAVEAKGTERAIERAALSKEWVLTKLRENAERAMQSTAKLDEDGNPIGEYRYDGGVANRALELLGRELGMFIDRAQVESKIEVEHRTVEEKADAARAMIDAVFAKKAEEKPNGLVN